MRKTARAAASGRVGSAHSRTLPVEAILARLSNRLAFLTGGAREQPARHRTLRAAIEWSYDPLTTSEQVLFRQLGIFAGDWSLAAAGAVVDPPGAPTEDGDAAQALARWGCFVGGQEPGATG